MCSVARGCQFHRTGRSHGDSWSEYVPMYFLASASSTCDLTGNLPHFTSGGSVHIVVKSVIVSY